MEIKPKRWVKKILFNHDQIQQKILELSEQVNRYYKNYKKPIVVVGILKGCIPFLSELILHLDFDIELDFMVISSFKGAINVASLPQIKLDLKLQVTNRDILIIEDIIDSGKSLQLITDYLKLKGSKSIRIITLIDKPNNRTVELEADWTGFESEDSFLVGYGLDYKGIYRNLPYIATVDQKVLISDTEEIIND